MNALQYTPQDDLSTLDEITKGYLCLVDCYEKVLQSYNLYVVAMASTNIKPLNLTKDQAATFKTAYENRPAKFKLKWIDELLVNDLLSCPMCGGLGGRTLEHYLPKTPYPEFSIFSHNLFPSCGSCNSKRGARNKYLAFPALLHPYFDGVTLGAVELHTVVSMVNDVARFDLCFNRLSFDVVTRERIDHHINVCIDTLDYSNHSSGYLKKSRLKFKTYESCDEYISAVQKDIKIFEGCGSKNSWEAAFMRGMLKLTKEELKELLR